MRAKKLFESTDDLSNSKGYVAACIIMQSKVPVHYSVMIATDVIWTDRIQTAATDGIHIYVNPSFFRGLESDEQRAFLLAHEAAHIMLRHPQRGQRYRERGYFKPGMDFRHNLYNWAADAVINDDLIAAGLEFIPSGIHEPDKYTRNDIVDAVYESEWEPQPDKPDQGEQGDSGQSDNQTADSKSGSGDDEPTPTDHDGHDDHFEPVYEGDDAEVDAEADEETIRNAVDDGIEEARAQGKEPSDEQRASGNLSRTDAQRSGMDWRGELADRLNRCGNDGDVVHGRIHRRRYATLGIISPPRQGRIGRLIIEVDISGSVCRDALNKFLVETAALIDTLQPRDGVLVLFVNTKVVSDYEVTSGSELLDLPVPCGGGTRMMAGVDYARSNGLDWDLFMCFTDGMLAGYDFHDLPKVDNFLMVLDGEPIGYHRNLIQSSGIDHIRVV